MFESKYSKVLTTILVVVIIAIVGLLGFLGYEYYKKYIITKDTSEFVNNFQGEVSSDDDNKDENVPNGDNSNLSLEDGNKSTGATVKTYKGFAVVGTIEIPAINITYPILEKVSTKALNTSVCYLWGPGVNQPGNSVIIGHNYRNGLFFSNNGKLKNGDKIYLTDNSGNRMTYTIYNKFNATPEDSSFYQRDTGGKPEVTLSTCNDDSSQRIIIEARIDE